MFESRSALASVFAAAGEAVDHRRLAGLTELPAPSIWQLGVYPGGAAAVAAALSEAAGLALPDSHSTPFVHQDIAVYRLAADQYWLLSVDADALRRVMAAVPPMHGSSTDLSGSRVVIGLDGECVRDVLAQTVTVDLADDVFPVGHFVQTGIHHVGGLLERTGDRAYRFIALRTFAQDTFEVLADAAAGVGEGAGQ